MLFLYNKQYLNTLWFLIFYLNWSQIYYCKDLWIIWVNLIIRWHSLQGWIKFCVPCHPRIRTDYFAWRCAIPHLILWPFIHDMTLLSYVPVTGILFLCQNLDLRQELCSWENIFSGYSIYEIAKLSLSKEISFSHRNFFSDIPPHPYLGQ